MKKTIYDGFMAYIYDSCPYFGKWRADIANHYLSKLEHIQNREVLELGTSTGLLTIPIAKLGFCVDTVDYSKDMHRIAKKKLKKFQNGIMHNVNFILSDITKFTNQKKYGAIVIPDSLLTVISEDGLKHVLYMSYDALENNGLLIFDVFKPIETVINSKKHVDVARFRDQRKNVYIVEATHEADTPRQIQVSTYNYKKRLSANAYIDVASATILYRYKYLPQILTELEEIGFSNIEIREVFDGKIYFITARKCVSN